MKTTSSPQGHVSTNSKAASAAVRESANSEVGTFASGRGLAQYLGNQGMQRLLNAAPPALSRTRRVIQTKLSMGAINDPLEAEADRIADQVLAVPAHSAVTGAPLRIQRYAGQASEHSDAVPASVGRVLAGSGSPLSAALRQDMEQRFGHDFSQVRVHCDAVAEQSAQDVHAQAYTVGHHLVFGAGRFEPGTRAGRQLLAHELTHVVQQGGSNDHNALRRRYRLPELQSAVSGIGTGNLIGGSPATLFYPGSAANTADRRAFVIAGIHGTEDSAIALGAAVDGELGSGTLVPDFHTLFVPRVNPSSGRGTSRVPDLNREFGGSSVSAEPIAGEIQAMVSEFEPERILTIHAVSNVGLGGLFLDPIRTPGTAQDRLDTAARREAAFASDARNRVGMTLAEDLIGAVRAPASAAGLGATPGNTPGRLPIGGGAANFPANRYPTSGTGISAGASPYNLLYPEQRQVRLGAQGETSLGVWASQLPFAPAVITLEVPGYAISPGGTNWRPFLPAVRQFLRLPAPAPSVPAPRTPTPSRAASSATLRRTPLSEADLTPRPGVPFSFMQGVYRRQVAIWTARGVSYTHEVPGRDRAALASSDVITGRSVSVHRDIATAVHNLLVAARTDLAAAGSAASSVTGVAVRSGYRSATEQFSIWQREFARYYRDTRTARAALSGGEHGSAAAQHLADYINQRVFSPGYSPHQRGRTIDFSYQSATDWPSAPNHWAEADSSPTGIATWSSSWFYGWLRSNAGRYGFAENPAINEPWHWEWSPPRASLLQRIWQLLLRLWRLILRMLGLPEPPPVEDDDSASPEPAAEDAESPR